MMTTLFYDDVQLGFAQAPARGIVPNANGRFNQVIDLVRGGIDTFRQNRGLPQYYPQPAPPPQASRPRPSAEPEGDAERSRQTEDPGYDAPRGRRSSGGGLGLSWDNEGLHLGDSITLSPTMLIMIGAGIYLLQSPGVTRRSR